jgi:single-strand DNA-binding protein
MTNYIRLEGRFSGEAELRTLPSGDEIAVFRIVVPRAVDGRVDTIDCQVNTAVLRRKVLKINDSSEIRVEGALHRRFWRGSAGLASRYEVEVKSLQRIG